MSRSTNHARWPVSVALVLALLLAQVMAVAAVSAQAGQTLVINQIDGRGWPNIDLNITLTGPDGKAIPGVDASQFEVREEDQPQTVTGMALGTARAVPLYIVLAIDVSGSMSGAKLDQAKQSAIAFVGTLGPTDTATLLAFNANVIEVVPPTTDHAVLEQGINALQPGGNTAAFDALYKAAEIVTASPPAARRVVVLLTDGEDTSSVISFDDVLAMARKSGINIYTICLQNRYSTARAESTRKYFSESDFAMKTLAQETGALSYFPQAVQELKGIYASISDELSNQYSLGYSPTNWRPDGRFRRIVVKVNAHPEFRSRPNRAHPLFAGLVKAAVDAQRAARLVEVERPVDHRPDALSVANA